MKYNGWNSYLCLEIVEQMNKFALLNFKILFFPDPHTGKGLRRPSPDPTPSAPRRSAPPCLARDLRPLHRPSPCVVDIFRYFRPCPALFINEYDQQLTSSRRTCCDKLDAGRCCWNRTGCRIIQMALSDATTQTDVNTEINFTISIQPHFTSSSSSGSRRFQHLLQRSTQSMLSMMQSCKMRHG